MKKQSSRSQRGSKGIKGKHILQICVLLSVCIWLIYQVKYSHDKKKEFYEKDEKKSSEILLENKDGLVKLGRKDLVPVKEEKQVEEEEDEVEEVNNGEEEKEKTNKEDEEEDDEEEDKSNKQGEEEDEVDNKHEEDEIDEQDESKDSDKDDEVLEEEKESKHVDEIDEARDEHYKADDASSAVSHESRVLKTEKSNESSGNLTRENDPGDATSEVKEQPFAGSGNKSSNSETTELRGETTVNGNLNNETEIIQEPSHEHYKAEDGAPPPRSSNFELEQARNESDHNVTVFANITSKDTIQDESRNSTSESSLAQNIIGVNTTEIQENPRSESDDEKEQSNQISREEMEEADDTSETNILQEEREALTDPQTLPDIRIEGNEEDE